MKQFIITEEEKNHIKSLYEEINPKDLYLAILGYLDKHGDSITNDSPDRLYAIAEKKEVMKYCEDKRDNKTPSKLSTRAEALLRTISKMVEESSNINSYIEIGKNIKHIS